MIATGELQANAAEGAKLFTGFAADFRQGMATPELPVVFAQLTAENHQIFGSRSAETYGGPRER